MSNLFTAVSDFIRERSPEAKMLREQISEAELPPVEMSEAQVREMGYENRNDFRRARIASGEMADNEFVRDISNYMGPYRSEAVDPSHYTQMYGPRLKVRGFYQPNAREDGRLSDLIKEQGEEIQPDMVYVPSVVDANPKLQAHEFGHRADYTGFMSRRERQPGEWETVHDIAGTFPGHTQESIAKEGFPEHKLNYLLDAWRADSPENWRIAIRGWRMLTNDRDDYSTSRGNYETYWKAHRELSELLQLNKNELLDLEASALEQQALDRKASIEEMLIRKARGLTGVGFRGRMEEVQEEVDRLDEVYSPENLAKARERDLANLTDQAFERYKLGRSKVGVPSELTGIRGLAQ